MATPVDAWLLLLLALMAIATMDAKPAQHNDGEASNSSTTTADCTTIGTKHAKVPVEKLNGTASESKRELHQNYDVIDVLAASTASGKARTGQTTRIYTTGEVNDDFWLKHLGDDFKHAIHLQVGGTDEEYNRLLNQTQNGVHEQIFHEYLPGAERVTEQEPTTGSNEATNSHQRPSYVSHLSIDGEGLALKQRYLEHRQQQDHQEQQEQSQQSHLLHTRNTAKLSKPKNNNKSSIKATTHYTPHIQHTSTPTPTPKQTQTATLKHNSKTRKRPHSQTQKKSTSGGINSSEDTLHSSSSLQDATLGTTAGVGTSTDTDVFDDTAHSHLPFKSPFNDYGNRPTRDVTHELYQSGL